MEHDDPASTMKWQDANLTGVGWEGAYMAHRSSSAWTLIGGHIVIWQDTFMSEVSGGNVHNRVIRPRTMSPTSRPWGIRDTHRRCATAATRDKTHRMIHNPTVEPTQYANEYIVVHTPKECHGFTSSSGSPSASSSSSPSASSSPPSATSAMAVALLVLASAFASR